MWAALGSLFGLLIMLFTAYQKATDTRTKEKSDAKKEISDAVASGDVSRINASINKLRR